MTEGISTVSIVDALARRRNAVAASCKAHDAVVLIGAGEPILRPGRADVTYPFESHSDYYYLTDRNTPGGVLAYDPSDGWIDFLADVTPSEQIWSGMPPISPEARTTAELADWLALRGSRTITWLGSPPPSAALDDALSEELHFDLGRIRRVKDSVELARIRIALQAVATGFSAATLLLHTGVTERELQVELERHAFLAGADALAFETVVAGGPNSAVLHLAPTARPFAAGELVLIDAGVQHLGYASDITRTYAVDGTLNPTQQQLHAIVRRAEQASIERCRPGTEWRDVHLTASLSIAEGLTDFGVLKGRPESLVDSGAASLFFPHGIGHLVGLGARDAGGTPLRERRNEPKPYPNLRMDLPLEAGMVTTVEPGIYFIPTILEDADTRRAHRDHVAWGRVDSMLGFGGIRIEDNVLITDDGCVTLSADIPLLG